MGVTLSVNFVKRSWWSKKNSIFNNFMLSKLPPRLRSYKMNISKSVYWCIVVKLLYIYSIYVQQFYNYTPIYRFTYIHLVTTQSRRQFRKHEIVEDRIFFTPPRPLHEVY